MKKPTLVLLPNLLSEELSHEEFLPKSVDRAVLSLDGLIAESERGARRFLRRFSVHLPIQILNEHTSDSEREALLAPILQGQWWGVISDCGLPCLADPGAALVLRARERGIAIQAFSGPSSLLLGLMLSGLPAQRFAFHGYLPREREPLVKQLHLLELRSAQEKSTQLFIEAPYRNEKLLSVLLEVLSSKTHLSVAWDLTLPTQGVITQTLSAWRKATLPSLHDKPAIFAFFSH